MAPDTAATIPGRIEAERRAGAWVQMTPTEYALTLQQRQLHAERVGAQITAALRFRMGRKARNHLEAALRLLGVSDA